ncbi:Tumor protein D54-like protein [Dinothrombium tinctorium]|uniref:Tumor protein D54-like protein n=1 Tax=Dinothrombium tinctorium TaxID=1965070 RepID=A0A3S3Q243_9ACAR|nr:Tumor protein D54-like protein [Dinothrombium tinctorium]
MDASNDGLNAYAADDGIHESSSLDLSSMDAEQRAQLEEEWRLELTKTEEEIQTLRQVLSAKVRHAQELKRKLGITVWKEFQQDLGQGVKNIQESTAYQKTSEVVKIAGEKTTSVFGTLGGSVARKLGEVKNSNAFKSFEERVSSTVSNVKTRMGGSRSNSTNSFEDALNSTERRHSQTATPATTPTIPEEKPIS